MTRLLAGALSLLLIPACAVLFSGCADENPNEPVSGGGAAPGPGAGPGGNPKLKAIMTKVGKGPQSLQNSLKEAMKEEKPGWDAIGPKAKEYAQLASDTGSFDPPRGDKSSWAKLTKAFAESASDLDKAAQAKDKEKTLTALDSLGNSCQSCHREHRKMRGPGGGRPGGPPPPGGPGGPPPGGGPGGPPAK